jgi:hypothetical protein
MRLPELLLGLSLGAASIAVACSNDAVGVDACRQVEAARCHNAAACNDAGQFDLGYPVHRGSPTTDVEACIRFYDDACLHGLVTTVEPGTPAVQQCVAAINASCNAVINPENDPACAWLIPPAPPPDAGAEAGDGATDGAADGSDAAGE